MKSWSIFSHSLGMVLRNFQQAVQIGLVPMVIAIGLNVVVLSYWGLPLDAMSGAAPAAEVAAMATGGFGLAFALVALAGAFSVIWIVVSWHRFVLLEEYPQGWFPKLRLDRMLAYVGHALLLIALVLIAIIPLAAVFGLVAVLTGGTSPVFFLFVWATVAISMMVVMYRMLPVLPAAAIGKSMKLKEAWVATAGANGTLIGLAIITFLFGTLVQLASIPVSAVPVLGPMVVYAASLVLTLVNVSILTTLYGHYVEGRPV